jgi:acyl-CoA reductase-like NAD-dependent aldehyde dehydrogenase
VTDHYRLLIDGELVDGAGGDSFATVDPGTGEVIASVAHGADAEVEAAVAAARRAFDGGGWCDLPPLARAELILELADLVQAHIGELALIEARDSGGVLPRTTSDVLLGVRFMRAMAKHAAHGFPWQVPVPGASSIFDPARNYVRREPIGVCAAIIPWNFPLLMAIWKVTMAVVMGNTIVLKPSPETPLSALVLARLVARAGFPRGVINVIVGPGRRIGELLVAHPGVDRIAFTGSTSTGKAVARSAADTLKRVNLELGGKSANIVMPGADLDLAVDGALFASMFHSGQVCHGGTRLLLHDAIHDPFLAKLTRRAAQMTVGYQLDPATRIGPVISDAQRTRIEHYIAVGDAQGARRVLGADRDRPVGRAGGFYVAPTIFADVRPEMTIAREEIFGPVLAVLRWRDEAEAIAIANDSRPPSGSPPACAPGRCGSTTGTRSIPRRRSAATSRAGSAASSASTAWPSTPRSSTCTSPPRPTPTPGAGTVCWSTAAAGSATRPTRRRASCPAPAASPGSRASSRRWASSARSCSPILA